MSYTKHFPEVPNTDEKCTNYVDGTTVLTAEHMGKIRDAIQADETYLAEVDPKITELESAKDNVVLVQSTQPASEDNKIWIPTTQGQEVEVPTYDEFTDLKSAFDTATIPLIKTLTWTNGYIDGGGVVRSSSLSAFTLVSLNQGESVKIGTANSNITIIGSTTSSSIGIGDTVTVIQKTTSSGAYEEYTYTAEQNINIALCVLKSNYNCIFYKKASFAQDYDNELSSIEAQLSTYNDYIPHGITDGYIYGHVIENGSFNASGLTYNVTNRIRTGFVEFKSGDKIVINNGGLRHSCGMWEGTPSESTIKRNDSVWNNDQETIIAEYDGYIVIVFSKSDNSNLTPSDFDGNLKYYNTYAHRIGNKQESATSLPDYYFTNDYLTNKVNRINELGKLGDDVFVFITDVHWELNARHSPNLISYLNENCALHKIVNGGDVANATILPVYKKYRKSIDGKTYYVAGNHDYFAPATGKDLYYCMDSANNDQVGNAERHYYYVDNVQQKIRYIVLSGFDRDESLIVEYEQAQIDWFASVALDLPDGYDAIVFTHFLRVRATPTASYLAIENAIDAFNSDASHTGKILSVFQGHTHWDAVYHTQGGLPVITTTCDKWDLSMESAEIPAEGIAWREKNTIREQAFDVVILNREEHKFTCVRIGAPAQNNIDKYRTDEGFTWIGTLEEREIIYEV